MFSVLLVLITGILAMVQPAMAERGGGNYYYQGTASSIITTWGDSCDEVENVADWSMRTQVWGNFSGSNVYIDRIDVINETNIDLHFGQYSISDDGGSWQVPISGISPNNRATVYPRRWITGSHMLHWFTASPWGQSGACYNGAPIRLSVIRY
ncbi:hypothetical protein [Amycolatopsis sp. NPDC059657]|uniref:hypothetical protein n=1 Tax=Amycolatopsis sp. NPDC059657 TaxID=3346899 RepID=UPI00366ECC9E